MNALYSLRAFFIRRFNFQSCIFNRPDIISAHYIYRDFYYYYLYIFSPSVVKISTVKTKAKNDRNAVM